MGAVLEQDVLADALSRHGRGVVREVVRQILDEARAGLAASDELEVGMAAVAWKSCQRLEPVRPLLELVINATGILLHTGLGRAPLAAEAIEAVRQISGDYCNLEYQLIDGKRGRRTSGVTEVLRLMTGAQSALVVNNNAAATVLAVRALAAGKEVIVSRGQLVEIGGSFRLPEILEVSGARLREVGTTNKTRLSDYARAITAETAVILRVHPSNYRIVGFTEDVPLADLVALARERGLAVIDDIGSGALASGLPSGVTKEPTVMDGVAAGADLVLFSGDKLLGGPQCGIMVGSRAAIKKAESDPLARALRVDKMTIAALEATLFLAANPVRGRERIPLWSMIETPVSKLMARAEELAGDLRAECGWNASAIKSEAWIGGGSAPRHSIASAAVAVSPPFPRGGDTLTSVAAALRQGKPPVVARLRKNQLIMDLRAVPEAMQATLRDALFSVAGNEKTANENRQ